MLVSTTCAALLNPNPKGLDTNAIQVRVVKRQRAEGGEQLGTTVRAETGHAAAPLLRPKASVEDHEGWVGDVSDANEEAAAVRAERHARNLSKKIHLLCPARKAGFPYELFAT